MPSHPDLIGRYEIRSVIGEGGMGRLFLAWDPRLEREVALKLLREGLANPELLQRFEREARSVARLRHQHIVTIFDVGEHDGQPYISMEYVPGQTLGEMIRESQPMSVSRKLELLEELCAGIGYAHRHGIVHRDIKPANLMVDAEGALKILDFGIARLAESGMTQAGVLIGTLNYMSPEQMSGQTVDARSDIFAIGAVAYELFTYRQAFPGGISSGIVGKILQGQPESLEVLCPWLDREVIRIVERALQKNPDARYQDLKAMRADLLRARQNLEKRSAESTAIPVSPDEATIVLTPQPPGRSTPVTPEIEEIGRRRRSQIESWLTEAERLIQREDYDAALRAAENALLLDNQEPRALEAFSRARAALDARQADEWARDAQQRLERGEMTLAEELVERALALNPGSSLATRVRDAVGDARRKQQEELRRQEALRAAIATSSEWIKRAEFEAAVAILDQALVQSPDHPELVALRARAREAIDERTRLDHQKRAGEAVTSARADFDAGRHTEAIAALGQFDPPHDLVSSALEALQKQYAAIVERARVSGEQLEIASRALTNGDLEGAARAMQVAKANGAARDVIARLTSTLREARAEAERRAKEARERHERRVASDAQVAKARQAATPQDAIAALNESLQIDPENAEARELLAEQHARLEREEADRREREQKQARAKKLVDHAARTPVHADAVLLLREAVAADETLEPARAALAERERALQEELEAAKERRRRREDAQRLVARAAATPDHSKAVAILREAVEMDDTLEAARARLTERERAREAEVAAAKEVERRRDEARRLVDRAAATGDHKEAIALLRNALETDGTLSAARTALTEREQALEAEAAAEKERARRRKDAEALVGRAARAKDHRQAIALLQDAIRTDDTLDAARTALATRERALEADAAAAAARAREEQQERERARAREQELERQRERERAREQEKARQREETASAPTQVFERAPVVPAPPPGFEPTVVVDAKALTQAPQMPEVSQVPPVAKETPVSRVPQVTHEPTVPQMPEPAIARERRDLPLEPTPPFDSPGFAHPSTSLGVTLSLSKGQGRPAAGISPAVVKGVGAAAVLAIVVAGIWLATRDPEPTVSVTTTAATTTVPATASVPGTGTGTGVPPAVTSVPAVVPTTNARVLALQKQAAPQLTAQPAAALKLLTDAIRIDPKDAETLRLLDTLARSTRDRAAQARTANRNPKSALALKADQASRAADRLFRQGRTGEAARGWLDALAIYDQASREVPQVAQATTSIPVAPATTTSVPAPVAVTTIPPAPTPVAPTPTTIDPSIATRASENAVRNTIRRYTSAYSSLDIDGIRDVYPGVDTAAVKRSFDQFKALEMTVDIKQVLIGAEGTWATVSGSLRQVATPKAGPRQTGNMPVQFRLERRGDNWIIVERR